MKLFVPRQHESGETRVALIPAVIRKLASPQVEILVEKDAGLAAACPDASYQSAGARIVSGEEGWSQADLAAVVRMPAEAQARSLRPGAILVGMLAPHANAPRLAALASQGVTALALEYLPRITRAQAMDTLSSQANLAGYKAVILAAEKSPRIFPMLMTAAGTIQPARVFILGVGVAGLQAIATAKRLGAIVSAYDVRPAVKEQVQSVGARFVELPLETAGAQDAGGYAKELTAEQQQKQQDALGKVVGESDIVITTAAVPGKPAPRLITAKAVAGMAPGSVIVDLAAESGGNCELTRPGEIVNHQGVAILGATNLPATIPVHASQVYAHNIAHLLKLILRPDGTTQLDLDDEIIAGVMLCRDGAVVHPRLKELLGNA